MIYGEGRGRERQRDEGRERETDQNPQHTLDIKDIINFNDKVQNYKAIKIILEASLSLALSLCVFCVCVKIHCKLLLIN